MLCSGKVFYDLADARDAENDGKTALLRLEQLYPFPGEPLMVRLRRMTNLKTVVWAQEEPQNAGAWSFIAPFIEAAMAGAGTAPGRPIYAGRAAAAATATGLMRRHNAEQAKLVAEALGASKSEVNAAIRGGLKPKQTAG